MDWNKFVKAYKIDIGGIEVEKEVSRSDIIMTLLNEGEVAFKSEKGSLITKVDDEEIREIIFTMIRKRTENEIKKTK